MRLNGDRVDLGTIDIARDRERGVPRYNDFRERLRKRRIKKFEDLTDDPELAEEIRDVYDDDIDRVDLQVGMLAEPLPPGFGFSDTAFRIFILMASRRLKSDRFFTNDYSPDVYTPEGLAWVEGNTMVDVLLRHHPELAPGARGLRERVRALAPAGLSAPSGRIAVRERALQRARDRPERAPGRLPAAGATRSRRRPRRTSTGRRSACSPGCARGHNGGPVWVRVVRDKALLLLTPADVHRALEGSPDPFAVRPEAEADGMAAFQPDALTISRGEAWRKRRAFNEAVLDTGGPLAGFAERFAAVAAEEAEALAVADHAEGKDELRWDPWNETFRRIARRVILGDAAADDADLSETLAEMMSEGNGMPGKTSARYPGFIARLGEYVAAGEPGSLVEPLRRRAGGRRDEAGRPDPALAVRDRRHAGDQRLPRPRAARHHPAPARAARVDDPAVPGGLPRGGDAAVADDDDALAGDARRHRVGRGRRSRPAPRS